MDSKAAEILLKARQVIKDPPMNGKNPHFKSKYALLKDVRDAIETALFPLNATLLTMPIVDENGVEQMTAQLVYQDGDEYKAAILCSMKMFGTDPQKQGSAQTYARRYLSCAALNLIGETDDDGNAATLRPAYSEYLKALLADGKVSKDDIAEVVESVAGTKNPLTVKPAMQQSVLDALETKFGKVE